MNYLDELITKRNNYSIFYSYKMLLLAGNTSYPSSMLLRKLQTVN